MVKSADIGREKLLREIAWLQSIPTELSAHFPQVLSVRSGAGWAEYEMPFYPWPDFAALILQERIPIAKAIDRLTQILSFVDRVLFRQSRHSPSDEFFKRNFLDKVENRVRTNRGRSNKFDQIVDAASLTINGYVCPSASSLLHRIATHPPLLSRLSPPDIGLFHGDFKFDNFLVNPDGNEFVLIDPRGATASGELFSCDMEDIAKLRTCTLGMYDLVRQAYVIPNVVGSNVDWHWGKKLRSIRDFYFRLDDAVVAWAVERKKGINDPHWIFRLMIFSAVLLLANAPFQLVDDTPGAELIAIMLYAIGTLLLHGALESDASEDALTRIRVLI